MLVVYENEYFFACDSQSLILFTSAFIKHTCTNLKEFVFYIKIHNYINIFNVSWISLKGHLYQTPYWNGHLELAPAFLYSLYLTFYNWWTSL